MTPMKSARITNDPLLPDRTVDATVSSPPAIDPEALEVARSILQELDEGGVEALERVVDRFKESTDGPILRDRDDCRAAVDRLSPEVRRAIESAAARVRTFAEAQRGCLKPLRMEMPGTGLEVGHDLVPLEVVGCYAPGGRYPLPSSVLMTTIPAAVAGVDRIRVASPRPTDPTLAAAWFGGGDEVLAAGGAQAIGALAGGLLGPACDLVVGPGNRFVTAAKSLVSGGQVGGFGPIAIDGLAGPSEVLVLADDTADPDLVAADLIAQAEHDPEAGVWLATTDPTLPVRVRRALAARLSRLPDPNRSIARTSLEQGGAFAVDGEAGLVAVADRLAPEHLEVATREPEVLATRLKHAGALFLGRAAEVFGDYGAGPNHVLPTGGTARWSAGLSVFDFLRVRTRMSSISEEVAPTLIEEVATLARVEGLEGHARAATARRTAPPSRDTLGRGSESSSSSGVPF